jgi:hypothetical protein
MLTQDGQKEIVPTQEAIRRKMLTDPRFAKSDIRFQLQLDLLAQKLNKFG